MLSKLKERFVDWYLTKRTGKNKVERDWEEWYHTNVNIRSDTVHGMFTNFEYVLEVDPNKFFKYDPFTWVPCDDAKQYFWPAREIGTNCVWRIERVIQDESRREWRFNEIVGKDHVFVATNSEADAVIIALTFS